MPRLSPEGSGYLLPAGADVLIQMHYHKSGKVETDATQVGLYLSDKPLPRQIRTGFVFPEISPDQGLKLAAKFQGRPGIGQAAEPRRDLRGRAGHPPGRRQLRGQGSRAGEG